MKAATLCPEPVVLTPGRAADYLALTKPRVAVLVLFTVAAGALLAAGREVQPLALLHVVLGTALVAAGASALNQWVERSSDARMRRTENRPLPAGRLQPLEVLLFGTLLGLGGVTYLALLSRPWAAAVAAVTFACYVGVYTPLKSKTTLNTLVGAVPGALPPVIGWCAVRGDISLEALTLFLVVFVWQVPHFLAIAWIYRDEYARAGLRMLPVIDRDGWLTGWNMVAYCLALIPASLTPVLLGSAGWVYLVGAVLLGLGFLASALDFWRARGPRRTALLSRPDGSGEPSYCGFVRTRTQARRVLRASLVYLPGLLALLLMDRALSWLLVAG